MYRPSKGGSLPVLTIEFPDVKNMETVTSFLERRLPHLEEMSEQQHALVTLINAACYVSAQASKQILFEKVCEHIGIRIES